MRHSAFSFLSAVTGFWIADLSVARAATEFGSKTSDWIAVAVGIIVAIFFIWKSTGGGRGGGSGGGGKSNYWGTGGS